MHGGILRQKPRRSGKKMKMNRARLLSKESAIDALRANNNFDCP